MAAADGPLLHEDVGPEPAEVLDPEGEIELQLLLEHASSACRVRML